MFNKNFIEGLELKQKLFLYNCTKTAIAFKKDFIAGIKSAPEIPENYG